MADISIAKSHHLSHRNAKIAAQKVADKLAEKFDMATEWKEDVLTFHRAGVSGTLSVSKNEALIEVTLGPLFKFFQAKIEEQIIQNMDKVFGSNV